MARKYESESLALSKELAAIETANLRALLEPAPAPHDVSSFDTESFGDDPESASAMSDEEIEKRARDLFIEDVDERSPEDLLEEIQRIEAGGGDDKPPDPPGSVTDSFDEDDEDDEDPSFPGTRLPDSADISSRTSPSDAARIEREIVQRRKREERLAILQQQRKAQLQMRIEQRERSLQNKLRRKQIQTEAREIETPETESTASDRIIRRLSAFSIGRSMGASGQLFAALSELMVFQPEEQAADALTKQSKEEAQQQKATQLEQLEKEILQQSVSDMEQSAKLQDIVDTARTQLADPSPEVSGDALSAFEQSLNDLVSKTVDPDSESPAPPQSTPESLSSRDSGGTTQPPTGPPSPPGPPGPPGPPTDPSQPESQGLIGTLQKQLGGLGQGLNTTTKVFLATAATVETLNIASKATTQTIKALGSVMQDPDNVGSAIKGAGSAASSTAQLGGGLAGGVIGRLAGPAIGTAIGTAVGPAVGTAVGPAIAASATAIGTAMAPGVGTLIGFALGSTLGRTIAEPIVEGISTVFGAMDSFANDSIGFETLQTSALGEIRILLEKMERQQKLDPLTAQFIEVRTELRSALGDLQGSLLELFGPSITKSVEFLEDITIILTATSDAIKVIKDAMPGSLTTGIKLTTGVGLMLVLLERLVKAADAAADILDKDNAPGFAEAQKVIDEFFNTQKQFDGLIPKFTFGP